MHTTKKAAENIEATENGSSLGMIKDVQPGK